MTHRHSHPSDAVEPVGREPDGLQDDVGFLLARANAVSIPAGNAALAEFGLRVRSYSVLALAASSTRRTQREIAEWLRLDPSQVVPLVDELEAMGLATRSPEPSDRRINVIGATSRGRALLARARSASIAAERGLHADVSAEDWEILIPLLRQLAFPRAVSAEED